MLSWIADKVRGSQNSSLCAGTINETIHCICDGQTYRQFVSDAAWPSLRQIGTFVPDNVQHSGSKAPLQREIEPLPGWEWWKEGRSALRRIAVSPSL
jgi:hypothetical protein